MSNTPGQTTQQNKIRLIVGEIGVDTETGIIGKGHSYDNGKTFIVDDTIYGRLYHDEDHGKIWNGIQDKVKTVVLPAIDRANAAVEFANSAIDNAKVTSDAAAAASQAAIEAKTAADSAAAEIQQTKVNAASEAAAIQQNVADMQTAINTANSANEEAVKSAQADIASVQSDVSQVKNNLATVSGNLDTYAKSAAEQGQDITVIKQQQGQFEADFASVNGKVNQLQVDTDGLRENVKDNQGNIASLQTSASQASIDLENAKSQVADLQITASDYKQIFADQDGRISKIEQTATEYTSEIADTKGNISSISQTVDGLTTTFADAQKDINDIKVDAQGLHETLTSQGSQIASLNTTVDSLDSKYSGITGDLQSKQTTLSTEQQQTNSMLLQKADKSDIDSINGTISQVSAEQKTMADQISQKVSSSDYQTLKDQVNGMNIGGRNLLIGTSENETSGKAKWFAGYQISGGLQPNTTYTLSGWARVDQTSLDHQQYVFVGGFANDWSWWKYLNFNSSLSYQYNKITFTTPSEKQFDPNISVWLSYPDGATNGNDDAISGTAFIKKLKLEEGNVATDWTPAPEDFITSIEKNSTAIDETNKLVSIKADKTYVDNVNDTAQQLSSKLDVMAGQIQSKVDETKVNNLIDGRGFATQSTIQSLIDQKAGTLSESITQLDTKYSTINGINLLKGTTDFSGDWFRRDDGSWLDDGWLDALGHKAYGRKGSAWDGLGQPVQLDAGEYTFSCQMYLQLSSGQSLSFYGFDSQYNGTAKGSLYAGATYDTSSPQNQWFTAVVHLKVTSAGILSIRPELNQDGGIVHVGSYKLERGYVENPVWTPAPSDNATVTQLQSVTASIDGLQSNVVDFKNNTSSQFTQLSNLIATKVSSDDYNSQINQLKDDINLRVTKGDLISQINLEVGTTLIQSNQIVLDAETTVFTGDAFIPNAALSSITADKITLGSTSLWDSNGAFNLVNISDGTKSKITTTHGDVYVDGILQNASIIQFSSDMNTNAFTVTPAGATVTPTLFFERYDQTPGHWLGFTRNQIRYEGVEFHTWDDDGERFGVDCHARFNKNVRVLGNFSQGTWDGTPGKPDAGVLYIKNGNTIWSGSNFLAIGDNLSNSYTNVMAKSFSQQSTLSAKTNIQPVDPKDALDLINRTDIYSYQYKTDVENGSAKRYTSLIIDDVNDVSKYYAPNEFVNEDRTGRDDGSTVGYLVLAVKELTNRIKALESNAK